MQSIINYIGKLRFNWIDIVTITASARLCESGLFVWALACIAIGVVLSVVIELKVKE